jgi:hypothetical protein
MKLAFVSLLLALSGGQITGGHSKAPPPVVAPRTTTVSAFVPWWQYGTGGFPTYITVPAFDATQGTLDAVSISWYAEASLAASAQVTLTGVSGCRVQWVATCSIADPCPPRAAFGTVGLGWPMAATWMDMATLGWIFSPPGGYHAFPIQYATSEVHAGPFTTPSLLSMVSNPSGTLSVPIRHEHYIAPQWYVWEACAGPPYFTWDGGSYALQFESSAIFEVTYHWH